MVLAERMPAVMAVLLSLVPSRRCCVMMVLVAWMPAVMAVLLPLVPSQWMGCRLPAFLAVRPPRPRRQQPTRQQQNTAQGYRAVTYHEADAR